METRPNSFMFERTTSKNSPPTYVKNIAAKKQYTSNHKSVYIIKEKINSFGAGLFDSTVKTLHCLIVVGSIKPQT